MATPDDLKLQKLEKDFNGGSPLDLRKYKKVLEASSDMGFGTTDVLEAVLVLGITAESFTSKIGELTDYLFDPDRAKRYKLAQVTSKKEIVIPPEKLKIIEDMKKQLRDIEREKQKQLALEQELKERAAVKRLDKYTEFLRGIVADEVITEREHMVLEGYGKALSITADDRESALRALDLTEEDMEDYRKDPTTDSGRKCVLCDDANKDFVVFDCMHVCLCETCAGNLKKGGGGPGDGGCPVCQDDITDIQRVYKD